MSTGGEGQAPQPAQSPIPEGTGEARLGTFRIGLLSLYWVAIGFLWLPLGNFVLTIMLRDLPGVGQAHQGTAVAILEGVGTLVAVFWQPVMGAVSDRTRSRFGRRKPYIFVATIFSALFLLLISRPSPFGSGAASGGGSLAWVFSGAFLWLFLLYFLLQVSENAAQAPYQGLLPDVVPEDERSRASAFVGSGNLFGILLGVVVVGTFMGMRRPDLALTSMAVFLVGAMLVTVLVFPDKVKPAEGARFNFKEVTVGTFAISPRLHKDFMWLMASRLLILVSANGLQKFAVFYFKDVFYPGPGTHLEGLASLASRDLQGIILLVALVATFPAAELSHRLGRRPFIVASGILGAIGTLGLIFSAHLFLPGFMTAPASSLLGVPETLSQALYFGVLIGIAVGIFLAVDWAYMVDVIPVQESGRFLGFSNIATASSGVIAGFLGGPLLDIFNRGQLLGQPGGYPVTFGLYVVFFLLGSLAIMKVRETRRRAAGPRPLASGH
ncbi:MAG TPA: MFS transporter [Candidatus Solibacter sp.]|nr:MFS transporter [Candidatus Solibacter sp.]